jgi:ABC-type Fe3+/spermidine/putrescine transport system ATPase subunit
VLSVQNIHKTYQGCPLLRGTSFKVGQGEIICLLGPSGSGKSTLLRIISGLEKAESGQVLWNDNDLNTVPVHRRNFGLMFQDYALFPHRTVAQNIAFGLRMQGLLQEDIKRRVADTLRQVNLEGFSERRVTDLSGGEQQRVALGRALAPRPRLLMLDEPLGALDRTLREQLLIELRYLLRTSAIPAIYVTHDQQEAYTISDRMILLHDGLIVQSGTPSAIHSQPASPWVARFLGMGNLLEGKILEISPLIVETPAGTFTPGSVSGLPPRPGSQTTILLRPGNIHFPAESDSCNIEGLVKDVVFQGDHYQVEILVNHALLFKFFFQTPPPLGSEINFQLKPEEIYCFGSESQP